MKNLISYILSDKFERIFVNFLCVVFILIGSLYLARLVNFLAEFIAYLLTF